MLWFEANLCCASLKAPRTLTFYPLPTLRGRGRPRHTWVTPQCDCNHGFRNGCSIPSLKQFCVFLRCGRDVMALTDSTSGKMIRDYSIEELKDAANLMRGYDLVALHAAGSGHAGGTLSIMDIT